MQTVNRRKRREQRGETDLAAELAEKWGQKDKTGGKIIRAK
jgi:hypothetical protein